MNLYENILKAESRIRPYIDETPLHHSPLLSQKYNASVLLKCEHQQKTGSFKLRGATNKVLSLTKAERSKGVVAASTGNHGKGVALLETFVAYHHLSLYLKTHRLLKYKP